MHCRQGQIDLNDYIGVGAGVSHTCALRVGRAAWCWGTNEYGQRGAASCAPQSIHPTAVNTSGLFAEIAVGAYHTLVRQPHLRVFA